MGKWNTIKQNLLFGLLLLIANLNGQSNMTLYQMQQVPQANLLNPALPIGAKAYFSLPFLSGLNVGWSNSALPIRAIGLQGMGLQLGKGESYRSILEDVEESNRTLASFQTDLLHIGWQAGSGFWSFSISEQVSFRANYSANFIQFLADAQDFDFVPNQLYDLHALDFQMMHYRSFALGYAKAINDRLQIGGRLKYLWGYSHLNVSSNNANAQSSSDDYTINGRIDYQSAGLTRIPAFREDIFRYLSHPGNTGWAIDLGFHYAYSDRLVFKGSLLDLGWINWKSDLSTASISGDIGHPIQYFEAERTALLNGEKTGGIAYRTGLSTRLYLGGNYYLNPNSNIGLLLQPILGEEISYWGMALSYSTNIRNWLNLSFNYNSYNDNWFHLGTGVSLNLGALQIYAISDNVLALLPKSKSMHWHTGINYTFGRIFERAFQVSTDETPDFWDRPEKLAVEASNNQSFKIDNTRETEASSPFFLLIGDVRNRTDGRPIDQINMDVYQLTDHGEKELVRTGRFPDGTFKIRLQAGKRYELFIEKAGFEASNFPIDIQNTNSSSQLFFLKEKENAFPLFAQNERIINERERQLQDVKAKPADEEEYFFQLTARTSLRAAATHRSEVLLRMGLDEEVKLLEKTTTNWWKVQYFNKQGWVKAKLLKIRSNQ